MRLTTAMTEADILEALRQEAARVWGPERQEAQEATLQNTAAAVWRVLQFPLEPTQEEPDFIR